MAECDEFGDVGLFRKAGHLKIGGMDAQQHARFFIDGVLVVGQARAIGCADLAQDGATLFHDFRDPKAVANFDQFTARNNHLAATSQGREGEQHSGGAIVHDDGGFGTGEALKQSSCVNVALATRPGNQVVLEIRVLRGGAAQFVDQLRRQRRAAQVGVKNDARRIDDRL